ncbi:MAG: HDIG domain-containing protein [Planctomycetota bacterium]|nr:MAG: HDIG domain-containing protein [Planctomycetota bacterium]
MAAGGSRRRRAERAAGFTLPPSKWEQAWRSLRQREVVLRIAIALGTAVLLCLIMRAWEPPLGSRLGETVARDAALGYPGGNAYLHLRADEVGTEVSDLRADYHQFLAGRSVAQKLARFAAVFFIVVATLAACGIYLYFRERWLLIRLPRLLMLLGVHVGSLAVAIWASGGSRHAEIIPLLLFAQTLAIAYNQELALLFSAVLVFLLALALGFGVGAWLVWMGTLAVAVIQLNRIRNRTKLLYVGMIAAVASALLRLAVAFLNDTPIDEVLLEEIGWQSLWIVLSGFLMTGLLPFVERAFGVLTDMSLLELTDLSHPLLQELARRAPSTYNHSINVGAIAEAAAESIGARGLLVRVGAYFHDIGKMLKPDYFIENQEPGENRHETLEPQLSSLVIIAHVKDGAELARRHGLPEPIIDFIEQHHGTTLVEYFYGQARAKNETENREAGVDETSFRYPGPPPQTKETAVLMLADALESATRALKEPSPARIETLVREIAGRKLEQGQFDESNLTLRELRTIEDSIIKSLVAMYHGRIKYPERKTPEKSGASRPGETGKDGSPRAEQTGAEQPTTTDKSAEGMKPADARATQATEASPQPETTES